MLKLRKNLNTLIGTLSLLLGMPLYQACGGGGSSGGESSSNAELETIEIPVSLTEVEEQSLRLQGDKFLQLAPGGVEASSFVMSLDSCASGLSGNNSVAGVMNVYLNDSGCLAKLASFVLNGQSYTPTAGDPFTTWLAGDTAVFEGSGPSDQINVRVISQLSSPIVAGDEVSYNFSLIKAGTNNASITVSTAVTLYTAGQDAPNFIINSGDASFDAIVSSGVDTGAGQFTFELTCVSGAMSVGANASFNSFCPTSAGGLLANSDPGVDVGNSNAFSYKLIDDAGDDGVLTMAEAQAAFASGDSTVTLATDILAADAGFTTISLTGPVTISANSKMILVLQAKNTNPSFSSDPSYSSYQYFPITLPTVTP